MAQVASNLAFTPAYLRHVPCSWNIVKAKWLFRETKDTGYPQKPLLSVTQDQGVIPRDTADMRVWNPGEDVSHYKLVRPGQFVISLRSFEGGIELSEIEGIVSPAYVVMEPDSRIENHRPYLRHLFKSSAFVNALAAISSGIRQGKTISFNDFSEMPLPIPPMSDAKQIADYLDRRTSRLDRLIAKKERLIELLEEQRMALIRKVVTKGLDPDVRMKDSGVEWLGKIPEHWDVPILKYIAELHRGFDLPSDRRADGTVPVISSGGVIDSHDHSKIRGPGVITGRYGSVGNVFYTEKDFWPLNTSLYVRDFRGNHPRFVYYLLQVLPILTHASKSAVPGVDRKDVHEERAPLPSNTEQGRIASALSDFDKELRTVSERIESAKRTLHEYRSALITAAVTGKIDVRDHAA